LPERRQQALLERHSVPAIGGRMKVTRQQFWTYLANQEDTYSGFCDACDDKTNGITEELFRALKALVDEGTEESGPIRQIIADFGMSEHHLGGDDLIEITNNVLDAIRDGYKVETWYGDDTETLIVGYKSDRLTVED
jgi:hypothetical protein